MARKPPSDDVNPEWTAETTARSTRTPIGLSAEFLAEAAAKRRPGQRGAGKKAAKLPVTIRLDPDVLAAYKAVGEGWQKIVSETLRAHMPGVSKGKRKADAA